MEAAGVERAHLVGNSLGAGTARAAAIARPELVASLTLIAPGYSEVQISDEMAEPSRRWRAALKVADHEAAIAVAREVWIAGPEQEARLREVLLRSDAPAMPLPEEAQRVERIQVPTLLVAGDGDDAVVLESVRVLAARIAGARVAIIPNARHHPHEDQPEAFLNALLAFIEQIPA
jgi:pimeloyl-ACP methyl ester carboxylesterase